MCSPAPPIGHTVQRRFAIVQSRLRGQALRKPRIHPPTAEVPRLRGSQDWRSDCTFWYVVIQYVIFRNRANDCLRLAAPLIEWIASQSDYLADSVDAFLTTPVVSPTTASSNPFAGSSAIDEIDPDVDPALPLGLTFSFPVEQTALNQGKVLTWTKGFSAKNAVGNDVVKLLQDAFDRKHLHVRCVALVNDVRVIFITLRLLLTK